MKELFSKYSVDEVVMFIIMLALAIKGLISFIDWAHDRLKQYFNKETKVNSVEEQLKQIIENQQALSDKVDGISAQVEILFNSDRDDIKAWITEKHHYFCYKLGYIDDFNLNCIEKRYEHYKEESGNSFVADLMADIRRLPIVSADTKQ